VRTAQVITRILLLAWLALAIAGAIVPATAAPAIAASDAAAVDRWTVDGGGGRSQSSEYTLTGTAGQADAGVSSGGNFTLAGGFWGGYPPAQGKVYVPILRK
jgi:hypothetical protein